MKWLRTLTVLIGFGTAQSQAAFKELKWPTIDKDIPIKVSIRPDLPYVTPGGKLGHWGVGNGGDWMRINFARAREYAAQVVLRINPNSLSRIASPQVREWIINNQKFLAADILQTEHLWVSEVKPSCAFTVPPGADGKIPTTNPIQFSYPTCRQQLQCADAKAPVDPNASMNFVEIAQLLIHEAAHHFNADETMADLIAIGIMDAWQSGMMDSIPLGLTHAPVGSQKHAAVWTGERMIVVGGYRDEINSYLNTAMSYDPATGEWNDLAPPAWFTPRGQVQAVWMGSELLIWGGFHANGETTTWSFDGALYNPKTQTWTQLSRPDFWKPSQPLVKDYPIQTVVWTGEKIIIWGGYDTKGQALGALFDPVHRSWSKMNIGPEAPRTLEGHSAVWTGEAMIVWGGYSAGNVLSAYGASYSPSTNTWKAIAGKDAGAPAARAGHQAVWTGTSMVIISGGGTGSSTDLTSTGGLYQPATDSWTTYRSELMVERIGHRVVWNGQDILLMGGQSKRLATYFGEVYAFNPVTLRWRVLPGLVIPPARSFGSIVWTGSSALVWGGHAGHGKTQASGAQYFP